MAAIRDGLRMPRWEDDTSPPDRRRTAFPMRRAILSTRNLHGTLWQGRPGALGAANRAPGEHRPLPRTRPWRAPGREFRPPADGAGKQRHPSAGCSSARPSAFSRAHRRRHRRLGVEAQPAPRRDHPRSRTAATNTPPAGSASPRPRKRGSPASRKSPSLRAIAAAAIPSRRQRRSRRPCRSPIAGVSWKTPATPFWTPCANRRARFAAPSWARGRSSIPNCRLPRNGSNMKVT